jgi:prophage regulatory protein
MAKHINESELILHRLDKIEVHLAATKQILTADEAASFLSIEKSYLYQLTHGSVIPFSKPGGKKLYFLREDLIKWALSNRSAGSAELDSKAATYLATHKK